MNREERERMVDRLLDQALASQPVEPRPGLEERVLAHLRPQPAPRVWWRAAWIWAPVAVAATVLVIVIGAYLTRSPQPARPPVVVKQHSAPAPEKTVSAATQAAARPSKKQPRSARRQTVQVAKVASPPVQAASPTPVPGQYPKPSPIGGPEFRALIAMLRGNPDEARLIATRQQESQKQAEEFLEQAAKH
jgi:hypothetical protein